ncbi:MAG: response regulator [Vicinamibacterales bacterium]
MIDETFLTTEEVLEYLQVNLRTVYRLIKAGKIPAVRVGRQWRFRKSDIDAWLDSQHSRPAARIASPLPELDVPVERPATQGHPRILVVDDEASVRELLVKTLSLVEYDVDSAADGRAALEQLRQHQYDLLITDLRMPGIDGMSVIREAKRQKANLPVIIITGFSSEAAAIEALNLGVSGYLTKPFRVPQVLSTAAKALDITPHHTSLFLTCTDTRRLSPTPCPRRERRVPIPVALLRARCRSQHDPALRAHQDARRSRPLDRVTWQIGDRERVGLCGPNGAGKTTLLKMMAGLEEPDSGHPQTVEPDRRLSAAGRTDPRRADGVRRGERRAQAAPRR